MLFVVLVKFVLCNHYYLQEADLVDYYSLTLVYSNYFDLNLDFANLCWFDLYISLLFKLKFFRIILF